MTKIFENEAKAEEVSTSLKGKRRKETNVYIEIFFLGVFNM